MRSDGKRLVAVLGLGTTLMVAAFASADPEGTTHNGLSSKAFRNNALTTNEHSVDLLAHHALDDTLFKLDSGWIEQQMADPGARAVMSELISCALAYGSKVTYDHPTTHAKTTWSGELGLCQKPRPSDVDSADWPEWGTVGPNEPCQQLVTACLTARVNALAKSIPLSIRSESRAVPPPHGSVHTDRQLRDSLAGTDPAAGIRVDSLLPSPCPPGRECGWTPGYVGRCVPGRPVHLAVTDGKVCQSTKMRVCDGIHGCDHLMQRPYVSYNVEQRGACIGSPLTFTCSGAPGMAGYYTVMLYSPPPLELNVEELDSEGIYPASEQQVFSFTEGAFYGNMFQSNRLKRSCKVEGARVECAPRPSVAPDAGRCTIDLAPEVPRSQLAPSRQKPGQQKPGPQKSDLEPDRYSGCQRADKSLPYTDIYACYSYSQSGEVAHDAGAAVAALNSRICDTPHGTCFPHPPLRCRPSDATFPGGPGIPIEKDAGCDPMGPDGAYGHCKGQDGDAIVYKNVITTRLNAPCDLLGDSAICDKLRTAIAHSFVKPGLHIGCGRCSAEARSGGGVAASFAAVVLLVLHRRRRKRRWVPADLA